MASADEREGLLGSHGDDENTHGDGRDSGPLFSVAGDATTRKPGTDPGYTSMLFCGDEPVSCSQTSGKQCGACRGHQKQMETADGQYAEYIARKHLEDMVKPLPIPHIIAQLETKDGRYAHYIEKIRKMTRLPEPRPMESLPEPLPVPDLNNKWQTVAWHSVVALGTAVPVLNVLAIPYYVYLYVWCKRHLIYSFNQKISAGILIYILLSVTASHYSAWSRHWHQLENDKRALGEVLQYVQMDAIITACFVGSVLFMRILQVNVVEIYAHVACHKARAERELESTASAKKKLDKLKETIPWLYDSSIARNTAEVGQAAAFNFSTLSIENVLVTTSTACMFVGLCFMIFAVGWKRQHNILPDWSISFMNLFDLNISWAAQNLVTVCMAYNNWKRFLKGVLSSVSRITQNKNQLLIFMALTKNHKVDQWSESSRLAIWQLLDQLEHGDSRANLEHGNCCKKDGSYITPSGLQFRLQEDLEDAMLDLKNADDILTWWALRKYIQTDFLDESAIMDFCCLLTVMLLLFFSVAILVSWMMHRTVWTCGVFVGGCMALTLGIVIHWVLQVCIDINALLEKDAQVLIQVEEELCIDQFQTNVNSDIPKTIQQTAAKADAPKTITAVEVLDILHRRVSHFDDYQQIFGVRITSQVRLGWVVSVLIALLSALQEIIVPWFEDKDINDFENMWEYITKNATFTLGRT